MSRNIGPSMKRMALNETYGGTPNETYGGKVPLMKRMEVPLMKRMEERGLWEVPGSYFRAVSFPGFVQS